MTPMGVFYPSYKIQGHRAGAHSPAVATLSSSPGLTSLVSPAWLWASSCIFLLKGTVLVRVLIFRHHFIEAVMLHLGFLIEGKHSKVSETLPSL